MKAMSTHSIEVAMISYAPGRERLRPGVLRRRRKRILGKCKSRLLARLGRVGGRGLVEHAQNELAVLGARLDLDVRRIELDEALLTSSRIIFPTWMCT